MQKNFSCRFNHLICTLSQLQQGLLTFSPSIKTDEHSERTIWLGKSFLCVPLANDTDMQYLIFYQLLWDLSHENRKRASAPRTGAGFPAEQAMLLRSHTMKPQGIVQGILQDISTTNYFCSLVDLDYLRFFCFVLFLYCLLKRGRRKSQHTFRSALQCTLTENTPHANVPV